MPTTRLTASAGWAWTPISRTGSNIGSWLDATSAPQHGGRNFMPVQKHLRPLAIAATLSMVLYLLAMFAGDARQVGKTILAVTWPQLVLILGLSLFNYALRFLRWQSYVTALGHAVPWRRHIAYYLAGFAFTVTPGKAGEAVRSLYLKPHGMSYAVSLAAFFVERLLDVLAIAVLAVGGAWLFPDYRAFVLLSCHRGSVSSPGSSSALDCRTACSARSGALATQASSPEYCDISPACCSIRPPTRAQKALCRLWRLAYWLGRRKALRCTRSWEGWAHRCRWPPQRASTRSASWPAPCPFARRPGRHGGGHGVDADTGRCESQHGHRRYAAVSVHHLVVCRIDRFVWPCWGWRWENLELTRDLRR